MAPPSEVTWLSQARNMGAFGRCHGESADTLGVSCETEEEREQTYSFTICHTWLGTGKWDADESGYHSWVSFHGKSGRWAK